MHSAPLYLPKGVAAIFQVPAGMPEEKQKAFIEKWRDLTGLDAVLIKEGIKLVGAVELPDDLRPTA